MNVLTYTKHLGVFMSFKKLLVLTCTTFLISSAPAFAERGTESGGGGDTVICNGKIRVLDSVTMEDASYLNIKVSENTELKLAEIENHLRKTLPNLGGSLHDFVRVFKQKGDLSMNTLWIKGDVKNINDENLFVELPKGCDNLMQAIVRVKSPFKRYYYNQSTLTNLSKNKDELSWMLVHEWLRDFTDDAEDIRILNAYLHSENFLVQGETEVQGTVKALINNNYNYTRLYSSIASYLKNRELELKKSLSEITPILEKAQKLEREYRNARSEIEKETLLKELVIISDKLYELYNMPDNLNFSYGMSYEITDNAKEVIGNIKRLHNQYHLN